MENKEILKINVADEFGFTLNTREAAIGFFRFLSEKTNIKIEFDFSKVEFISRSFADQFHKEKEKFQNERNAIIDISNATEEIVNILRIVAKTQNKTNRDYLKLSVFKYSDQHKLADYMLSV